MSPPSASPRAPSRLLNGGPDGGTQQAVASLPGKQLDGQDPEQRALVIKRLRQRLVDLAGRGDLNCLLREEKQHQVDLRRAYETVRPVRKSASLDAPELLRANNAGDGPGAAAILVFAWHKTLQVFAGGEQTVLAVTDWRHTEATVQQASGTISVLEHAETLHSSRREAMMAVHRELASASKNRLDLEALDIGLFDSQVLVVPDSNHHVTMRHPLQAAFVLPAHGPAELVLTYADELFAESTVKGFMEVFRILVRQLVESTELAVSELEYIDSEQQRTLDEWNHTDGDYDREMRLESLFEQAAAKTPSKAAVYYKDRVLTFEGLNAEANRLAHYLHRELKVASEQIIALFLDKSELMIATVLGIWKSGACYSPIDPTYPDARARFSLEDTGATLILTNHWHVARMRRLTAEFHGIKIIELEPLLERLRANHAGPSHNPALGHKSTQLCYVTYTSGTTGVPKGIKKRHTNVVNSITDLADRYEMKAGSEAVVLFSPYVFEPFARQTLIALLNSQALVVVDDDEKLDPINFPKLMRRYGVTYLNGTASVLQEFDYADCPQLKRLVLVGEDLTSTRYQDLRRKFKKRIINEYGFTESAFVTAVKIFEPGDVRPNRSLGRPLRNVKCYVLGPSLKRLPIGAIGELYIGGQGVSEGYLNRPELTQEKFLPNPYQTPSERAKGLNATMYRTGDLARWISGTQEVEYLGRNDFQIKLRGIRIEPGEIESVLASHAGVDRAVVVAKATDARGASSPLGSKHLIGYWTGDRALRENDLISHLESRLPRYMVPTRLVQLRRIPTTINGKVDFRALPAIELTPVKSHHQKPQDSIQKALLKIWSSLLDCSESHIGINDNFFRLGGNSVTCLQLVGQVRRQLKLSLTVEQIFAEKTIERLAALLKHRQDIDPRYLVTSEASCAVPASSIGVKEEVEAIYAANSLQQGFVYHYLKQNRENDAYTMQYLCKYRKNIDPDLYKAAWSAAQRRYCSLRLRFVAGIEVYQVVESHQPLEFRLVHLEKEKDRDSLEDKIAVLQERDREMSYPLDEGPLFRVYLIQMDISEWTLLFSCHHAILDGWSIPTLLDYVHESYVLLRQGSVPQVPHDSSYHAAQKLSSVLRHDNLQYWREKVEEISERCDLRGLICQERRYKTNLASYDTIKRPKEKTIHLKSDGTSSSSQHGEIMLHSVLQFICHKVLNVYGNGRQSVVGTIVSGRSLPIDDVDSAVGLYINTLPLIVDHDLQRSKTIQEAIRDIQDDVIDMNMRSSVDLGQLAAGKMTHELFDCLLVLENYPVPDKTKRERLSRELLLETHGTSEKLTYPLAFVCAEEEGKGIAVTLRYAAELFDGGTIDDILDVFKSLFEQVGDKLMSPVGSLEFLGEQQLSRIHGWNNSQVDYPQITLDRAFELIAGEHPDKTAIVYEATRLTYAELNDQANRLAQFIRDSVDYRPDCIVGLLLEKNIAMFVAILAVWKAGMAYAPIDVNFPRDRIKYILEDTRAVMVLASSQHLDKVDPATQSRPVVVAVEDAIQKAENINTGNLQAITSTTDLAYIYFTSGTTGKPKGVMIEHRGVMNLKQSLCKTFELQRHQDEVLLSFSNYTFDHFVEQMTDALLNGQTLLVLNDEMRADKDRLYRYMTVNRVTYLSGTPSVISMYEYEQFPWLRRIDCVGEDFSEPVFNKIRQGFEGLIINGYGPTEVSITTHKRLYWPGDRRANKSIGFQIDNSRTYVLDRNMKQVPIGAIGELYLGGDGVGRGYLNRPELTEERFPPNPYQSAEDRSNNRDARLYKTGDLVRWLSNGEIEYLGREDFQIKLRGQRVELGEIEAAITSCASIVQSVVVPQTRTVPGSNTSQKYLIGYFVASEAKTELEVKAELRDRLPEHLIPNRIVQLQKLPVTASGKLDAKKLPNVDYSTGNEHVAPGGYTEARLCNLWGEVLGIPEANVSVVEDFFSLGGDSLLSTKLSFVMTRHFGRRVTVANLFQYRNIRSLAHFIQNKALGTGLLTLEGAASANPPASFSQERLLFIDRFIGGSCAYNVFKTLELSPGSSIKGLEKALQDVVQRHAALRTLLCFDSDTKRTVQRVQDPVGAVEQLHFKEVEVNTYLEAADLLDQETQHVFKLDSELPIRTTLIRVLEANALICAINVHHTSIDAWSWNILLRDLVAFYLMRTGLRDSSGLEEIKTSYAIYSAWQRQQLGNNRGTVMQSYWLKNLAGFSSVNLPIDYNRPDQFNYSGRDLEVQIPAKLLGEVNAAAQRLQMSSFAIFAAAYCLLLSTYARQKDIVVGLPMANRHHQETENVVGCFINMVVLRVQIEATFTGAAFLKAVSRQITEAQLNQDYPLEELVRDMKQEYSPGRHPIFQHVFSSDIVSAVSSDVLSGDADWQPVECGLGEQVYSSSKFDLSTTITRRDNQTIINFNWPKALFNVATIERYAQTYQHLLEQLVRVQHFELPLCEFSLLPGLNPPTMRRPEPTKPEQMSLAALFEQHCNTLGDHVAIACGEDTITYRELDIRSRKMVSRLRQLGAARGDFIGIMVEPCIEMIASILAVWKLGAAYVPLATGSSLPRERLKHIIQDSSINILISRERYLSRCSDIMQTFLNLDESLEAVLPDEVSEKTTEDSIAYCIYTSGTTGVPKGVPVPHKGVLSLAHDLSRRYFGQKASYDREAILMTSNYVFDFSLEQFALSFLSGHKLVLLPDGITVEDSFYDYLNRQKLTYISGTPSVLSQLDFSRLYHLRMITSAGEQLQPHQYQRMRTMFSGPINNAYGTTETTIYNLVRHFTASESFENSLGDPIAGHRIYIANENCQLVPAGAVGELFISGDGVAPGYLNQPKITQDRFVPNPFIEECDRATYSTVYKTGDLVRRAWNGHLEYLGREDQQIKLRGFRIELGEVQSMLSGHPGVSECVVLAKSRNSDAPGKADYLVAYYASKNRLSSDSIQEFLHQKLPASHVPNFFVHVPDHLPTTIHGKLDTRLLPGIEHTRTGQFESPRNEVESSICRIWSEALSVDVSIHDDFFHKGGDSILSLQLAQDMSEKLGFTISVKDIFEYRTVAKLSQRCSELGASPSTNIRTEQGVLSGPVELAPIQKWFFGKHLQQPSHWNQCFLLKTRPLDINRLRSAYSALQEHHDAFRLSYDASGSQVEQEYRRSSRNQDILEICEEKEENLAQKLSALQASLDISQGKVAVAAYIQSGKSAVLWFAVHHLIVDVVSWRIIARDLEALYHGRYLRKKSTSYRLWAASVTDIPISSQEKAYWQEIQSQLRSCAIADRQSELIKTSIRIPTHEVSPILRNNRFTTLELLLTSVSRGLQIIKGGQIALTLEGHGRDPPDPSLDVSNTVGWFTIMYPFIVPFAADIAAHADEVRSTLSKVPSKGFGYGSLYGYGTLPSVTFNYLGQLSSRKLDASGWELQFAADKKWGATRSDLDAAANSASLDVTVWFEADSLNIEMDCRLESSTVEQLKTAVTQSLREVSSVFHTEKLKSSASRQLDFTPYFRFMEPPRQSPTLFLLPPGEGGAESYFHNLVTHLPQTQLVTFNNLHLEQPDPSDRFESLAKQYISWLRELQPHGPYNLLGWSFGGVLALEICLQLAEAGEMIGSLFFVDSYFDVRGASAAIGHPEDDSILDPINWHYNPNVTARSRGGLDPKKMVLFKAGMRNDQVRNAKQAALFDWYHQVPLNGLGAWMAVDDMEMVTMEGETHFTWVRNKTWLGKMADMIRSRLE